MIEPKGLERWFFVVAIPDLLFPRDLISDYRGCRDDFHTDYAEP